MANFGSTPANSDFSQMTGSTANDAASAGNIGEIIVSSVGIGTGPSLTTATPVNVTSIVLTTGVWDVRGHIIFEFTGATQSGDAQASISTVSATLVGDQTDGFSGLRNVTTTCKHSVVIPSKNLGVGGATNTFYLVAQAIFSAGTCKASGYITARRPR
jgi:hypothetical protein